MNYFVIALLASIGWGLGHILMEIIEEVILNNLHNLNWYCRLNRKPTKEKKNKEKTTKNKIGF